MPQTTLWGCLFLIYSAPLAMFWFLVRKSPKLVIMLISSAFMWLLAAYASAIVWVAIPPLKDEFWFILAVSVLIQESFRYLWWRMLCKAEQGLRTLAPENGVIITRERIALVSGLGFGLMSVIIMTANMLDVMAGPGMIPSPGCPKQNLFVISSLIATMNLYLHVFWGIIAFRGWDLKRQGTAYLSPGGWRVPFVVVAHAAASLLTLNNEEGGACAGTLVPLAALTVVSGFAAWYSANMKIGKPEAHTA
eukprot:TRINITY_DN7425_c0_g1_i2.p1 TRINITY_DN7425_c0_g1~~TRINITY_DN7425_c0_g1_i2.p1  ORF type:complete len:249 (+),score=22.59 TRINITY_DN7425_c0_g1_i2:88-834(+)